MDQNVSDVSSVGRLVDRQEIWDCMIRYCRGIDRSDIDLAASAYHADALDDHGMLFGTGRQIAEWATALLSDRYDSWSHFVTNHSADIEGDTAHCETYYWVLYRRAEATEMTAGRYIDRFERRDGVWKIAARVVRREYQGALVPSHPNLPSIETGGRDKSDVSYARPLIVRQRT
jgi:hypothetical protein